MLRSEGITVGLDFMCLAGVLEGYMQALTEDCHPKLQGQQKASKFNSESLKPIKKYFITC